MERNTQKNGMVNLLAAVMIFIAAFVVTVFVNSLAGQAASIFLGLGALVAFASWFQMRLEENERLEKLEMDELARAKGESALFDAKESEVFPARRSREQFEKFFVPGFAVLLFLLRSRRRVAALALDCQKQPASLRRNARCRRFRCSRFLRCCCFCSDVFP